MYLMETLEFFEPGVDPEYYRLASLDGQDRCLYSWGLAIPIGTRFTPDESRSFSLQKLIAPGEPAIFEDVIYERDSKPPPYMAITSTLDFTI
jgi:hypothetical protein